MGTFIVILIVILIILLLCGADLGEALAGIFIGLVCLAQWILPFVLLAWLISLFL